MMSLAITASRRAGQRRTGLPVALLAGPPSILAVVVYAVLVRVLMTFLLVTPPSEQLTTPKALAAAPEASPSLLGVLALIHILLGLYIMFDTLATAIRCRRLRLWDGAASFLALAVLALLHVSVVKLL